jgi:hypothetical protein
MFRRMLDHQADLRLGDGQVAVMLATHEMRRLGFAYGAEDGG